jgi:hypothetical protein
MLEWIDVFTTIALGLILRFGIPAIFTGLLLWLLKRLDERWQLDAEKTRLMQLAQTANQTATCWDVRKCAPELRAQCLAYQHPEVPCWQVMRQFSGRLPERCLTCQVFRSAPVPQPLLVH